MELPATHRDGRNEKLVGQDPNEEEEIGLRIKHKQGRDEKTDVHADSGLTGVLWRGQAQRKWDLLRSGRTDGTVPKAAVLEIGD